MLTDIASFVVDTDPAADAARMPDTDHTIGIDLGLIHFAVLSDGTKIDSPRFLRRAEKKLKNAQSAYGWVRPPPRTRTRKHARSSTLLADWEDAAREARKGGRELFYRSQGKGQSNLIKSFEQRYGLWETPNSLAVLRGLSPYEAAAQPTC